MSEGKPGTKEQSVNSWPESKKQIPVQLGKLLCIRQAGAGTLSHHLRSLLACLLVGRQTNNWRGRNQQWDSDLLVVVDSLHPPLNYGWEMSKQGSFVHSCCYGVEWLLLCREKVLVLKKVPLRGVAEGMNRREAPPVSFFLLSCR